MDDYASPPFGEGSLDPGLVCGVPADPVRQPLMALYGYVVTNLSRVLCQGHLFQ